MKYSGFVRNVAIAMGNSRNPKYRTVLERLAESEDDDHCQSCHLGADTIGRIRLRIILLLLAVTLFASAENPDESRSAKGFEHFYNLEYDQAIAEFRRLVQTEP